MLGRIQISSLISDLEEYEYKSGEDPTICTKPDERGWKQATRGSARPMAQQAAFAAQNLDDVALYDVEAEQDCGECGKKVVQKQHFA